MARLNRNLRYPIQHVLMVSTEVGTLIDHLAEREGLHKTEVLRSFLHAGIKLAGYGNILTVDKREAPVTDLGPES